MVRLKITAMLPGSVVGYVTKLYDHLGDGDKVKLLSNNKVFGNIPTEALPREFSSGKLIDLNAGELLGLGIIGGYYNLQSQQGKTYQVGVGLEDSTKNSIELVLSDGIIWENETQQKMAFQQTMVQGLRPERTIDADNVIAAFNSKVARRSDYPDNCGLIVNIYSIKGQIDFQIVMNSVDLNAYQANLVITYDIPDLANARVINLQNGLTMQEVIINSKQFKLDRSNSDDPWKLQKGN